jgi:hypothetical protein
LRSLKSEECLARQLIYEFDKEANVWLPSYAILNDSRIITENSALVAIEQLPTGLSLGLSTKNSMFPVIVSSVDDE